MQSSRATGGTGPFKIRLGAGGLHGVHWQHGRPSPGSNLFFALRHGVESEATLADDSPDAILPEFARRCGADVADDGAYKCESKARRSGSSKHCMRSSGWAVIRAITATSSV